MLRGLHGRKDRCGRGGASGRTLCDIRVVGEMTGLRGLLGCDEGYVMLGLHDVGWLRGERLFGEGGRERGRFGKPFWRGWC